MAIFRKKALLKTVVSVAAALLLIVIVSGTAYAANIGGIQNIIQLWIHGETTNSNTPEESVASDNSETANSTSYRDYAPQDMWAGTFRMDENGKILIRRGEVGTNDLGTNNKMAYYEEPEWTFELTDDVDIFLYYPIDAPDGAGVTRETFLELLKEYQIDCYFHLTEDEKIDYILSVYYS